MRSCGDVERKGAGLPTAKTDKTLVRKLAQITKSLPGPLIKILL